MMEEAKRNSTAADNYFDYAVKIMKENEGFLRKNSKETYREVIDLINDAIDLAGFAVERKKSREDYVKRSIVFFMYNILMPLSYAIHTELLTGNLPACFMELRLMLESSVKCYLADLKYPKQNFFQEKLELLEKEAKDKNGKKIPKREHDFLKEFDERVKLDEESIKLWGKLSEDWIHTRGVMGRIINQISEKSGAPSWALVIPMNYAKDDLDTIKELGKRVSQFRKLLKVTIDNYKQEFGFEEV